MAKSTGMQCVSYGCFSYSYKFLDNGDRVSSKISFFNFPNDAIEKNIWCNLIKRTDGQDNFSVSKSTRVCEKHFLQNKIHRPPGGTRKRLLEGARPILHSWNDYSVDKTFIKQPIIRHSPRKKCRTSTTTTTSMTTGNPENKNIEFDIATPDKWDSVESGNTEQMNNLETEIKRLKTLKTCW